MAPVEDDWSDSEDELGSEVETAVLLGIPDGPIDTQSDLADAAVSRIGGTPAFLPAREPSLSSSQCANCAETMELLVQLWCPFEDSPMDRALYVWGCARSSCQKKDGSIRAWRGIRRNEAYAKKLEKKLAKKKQKEPISQSATSQQKTAKVNPFSLQNSAAASPFGLGTQIFGQSPPPPRDPSPPPPEESVEESDAESDSSEESLITALASTGLSSSPWISAPSYPPLYLSTTSEYVPPPPKAKLPPGVQIQDPLDDDEMKKSSKDGGWSLEGYENSLEIDSVFDRFTKRVGYEGEQCIRYELKGVPLPFSSDKLFDKLFPAPPAPPLPVTKPDFKVVPVQKRTYTPASVPRCPICNSPRVFECQLMPNLINVLRSASKDAGKETGGRRKKAGLESDEERRKAVEAALRASGSPEKRAMEWGTCMVFSCENDCCIGDAESGGGKCTESWREEVVLVQWDD
ncbi:hypothetical protein SERLADRAFT_406196 [Serpula lacrymans var. lacrymans S7.9]|uniref:Programmed cell death protein 2 C-terminal domain-containing protein n=1 Tax=Serpula lacrymans var. lacrymans (strain S7.9) TaxID=578457 RepID=F8NKK9_SERL9|nr:uncharacterized protein SERLADRAFT_406196 [Serpula lacrymans var. lacrymans S7.9]EGO28781.1 hypothetical protein SERLADRAFT_406196 [Serpula lacrymans var. lacrymans S7.9]